MKILLNLKGAGIIFLAIVLFGLSMTVPVLASSAIDMNRSGSITINLSDDDSNQSDVLSGISFTVYKVATLSDTGAYTLTGGFLDSGVKLNELSTAAELLAASKALASYVQTKTISCISDSTNSEGSVTFKDLTLGYYLVMQTVTSVQSAYIICDPFLIPIPMQSNNQKDWIYHISAYPKNEKVRGAVIIEKMDGSYILLPGAVFRLENKVYYTDITKVPTGAITGVDSQGSYYWNEVIPSLTTNSNGQIAIKNMQLGQYRIIETKAPNGYQLNSTPYEFSITTAGTVKLVSGKYVAASGIVQTIKVINSPNNTYYYNTPTPRPSSTPTPSPSLSPTLSPIPTKTPSLTPIPKATDAPEEINIDDEEIPLSIPKNKITPTVTPKITKVPTGFDLPKTGGSVSYAVCTYGGTGLMICGAAVFILSRIKKP